MHPSSGGGIGWPGTSCAAGAGLARDPVAAPRSAREGLFPSLPFEHSESLADQARAVALTGALGNESWMHFARQHYDIIARFGRFPHRNAALGRESTAEELGFLAGSAGGF